MSAILIPLYGANSQNFLFVVYADEDTIEVAVPSDAADPEGIRQTASSRTTAAGELEKTGDAQEMIEFYLYNTMYRQGPWEELPDLAAAQQRAAVIVADPPPFVDEDDEEEADGE